jgi:hypothetical protein
MDKLKPSELLLLGSQQVKQCRNSYLQTSDELWPQCQVESACSIGMMVVAQVGTKDISVCNRHLDRVRDRLRELPNPTDYEGNNLLEAIVEMNDSRHMKPKTIAMVLKKHGF